MILAGKLKAQVVGDVAHGLERSVDVEQAHGRLVLGQGVKDKREAKLGPQHAHAAPAQPPEQDEQHYRADDGQNEEGVDELSQYGPLFAF